MGETAANNLGSHPGPHEAITGYLHSLFERTMNAAMSATLFLLCTFVATQPPLLRQH